MGPFKEIGKEGVIAEVPYGTGAYGEGTYGSTLIAGGDIESPQIVSWSETEE